MSTFTSILGFVAAACSTGCWLPQLARTVRTRSAFDFCWGYLFLSGGGVACWLAYGLLRADAALATANLVTIAFFLGVVAVKWRTERAVPSPPPQRPMTASAHRVAAADLRARTRHLPPRQPA